MINAWIVALLLALAANGAAAQDLSPAAPEYRLLAGDEIAVKMPLNPELDTNGPIGPDGRFSIPLAGRVAIGGMTLGQAEAAIAQALQAAKVVANARPGIVVSKYAGLVYVGGEVRTPGPVPLNRALDPLQAIVNAGGLLDTARSKRVAIIRQAGIGPRRVEIVNVREIVKTGGQTVPVMLAPGDVVFVPKSTIAEVDLFIDQYINKIVPNALHFNVNMGNNNGTPTTAISP